MTNPSSAGTPGKLDLLISFDVETDGSVPGVYSMLSLGAVGACLWDGRGIITRLDLDAEENGFYSELQPVGEAWEPEAMQVNGLDRERLLREGENPVAAIDRFNVWARDLGARHGATPIAAAYPLAFDFSWVAYYSAVYGRVPGAFGYSKALDIKTLAAVHLLLPVSGAGAKRLPTEVLSRRPHTHNALDDAREQAELLLNVLVYDGPHI